MRTYKTAAIFIIGCAVALSGRSGERDPEKDKERAPDGLYAEPVCDYEFRIKKQRETMLGEVPTGITASSSKWEMEIYANSKTGTWTLVGKSKDPSARLKTTWCRLSSGIDTPHQQEKWFQSYFRK